MLQIAADAAGERAIPERQEHGIERFFPIRQLQSDRPRPLAGFDLEPVFNHPDASRESDAFRFDLGGIEIFAMQDDRRAQSSMRSSLNGFAFTLA